MFFAALALTQFEYLLPDKHGLENQNWMVWVLLVRNLALVGVFGLLLAQLLERDHGHEPAVAPPTR